MTVNTPDHHSEYLARAIAASTAIAAASGLEPRDLGRSPRGHRQNQRSCLKYVSSRASATTSKPIP
jgi:hypothetical protein